jgi:hypothetical protein
VARYEASGLQVLHDAWLNYRQHPMYAVHAGQRIVGRSHRQPKLHPLADCLTLIERISRADADLKSTTALRH